MSTSEHKKDGLKYISLGYNCTLALTLRSAGIRTEAYPLDWLETDILRLPEMFRLRFSDFLTNVKSYIPTKTYAKNKPWPYFCDSKYKTFHWHDEPTISEKIIDKYKKRTGRLMKLLDDNEEELVFMRMLGSNKGKTHLEFWENDVENPELREFRLRELYRTDIKVDIDKLKELARVFKGEYGNDKFRIICFVHESLYKIEKNLEVINDKKNANYNIELRRYGSWPQHPEENLKDYWKLYMKGWS